MNIIDYTGKLNKHAKYIKVLDILEQKTKYIEVVLIDEKKTNYLVEKFNKDIVSIKTVSEWWGTKTSAKNKLIRIKSSSDLFNYLKQFETFCKYYEYGSNPKSFLRGDDYSESTDFGYDDIAFYNEKNEILLCTTTHEGYISISDELI
jgi:hypothetical protein